MISFCTAFFKEIYNMYCFYFENFFGMFDWNHAVLAWIALTMSLAQNHLVLCNSREDFEDFDDDDTNAMDKMMNDV